MKLDKDDGKQFPKFRQYVKYAMPTTLHVPVIVKNIKKFGSLSRAEFANAIAWGNGPTIRFVNLDDTSGFPGYKKCGGVAAAYGCFRSTAPDYIELDLLAVTQFETDPYGSGLGKNSRHQNLFIVGATMLHELCHWGNFHHGVAETTEQGAAFEVATYGKTIP